MFLEAPLQIFCQLRAPLRSLPACTCAAASLLMAFVTSRMSYLMRQNRLPNNHAQLSPGKEQFPPFLLVPRDQYCSSLSIANRQLSCLWLSHFLFFKNWCMYMYNKVSDIRYNRCHLSQLFSVTDLACVQLVHSCMTRYHTYYFENQRVMDFFSHIKADYRNPATAVVLFKEQSSVLFKFPTTLQGKTGWKFLFL